MDFIKINNLSFCYKSGGRILENLELVVDPGEIVIITGANGSGKTTLSRLILGLLVPEEGSIFINGNDIKTLNLPQIGLLIGYLFQDASCQLISETVEQEIDLSLKINPRSPYSRDEIIEMFALNSVREHFPQMLSSGEMKMLALASLLALNPPFFMLDEPTAGLDDKAVYRIVSIIRKLHEMGKGMLILAHEDLLIKELVGIARLLELDRGRLKHKDLD
jgi:energy-coupling factor transport system ATP-binding protein